MKSNSNSEEVDFFEQMARLRGLPYQKEPDETPRRRVAKAKAAPEILPPFPAQRMTTPPVTPPRGLRRVDAARYVGVSPTLFDQWVADGLMPKPAKIGGIAVWDRLALDRAFDALFDDDPSESVWDDVAV